MLTYAVLNALHDAVFEDSVSETGGQLGSSRATWTVDPTVSWADSGLRSGEGYMDRLVTLLDDHGVNLSIAVYPWPDQIFHADRDSLQVQHWQRWARKHDVTFLNYFPCFIPEPVDDVVLGEIIDTYFLPGDVHWNEVGHEVVAEGFLALYAASYKGEVYCKTFHTEWFPPEPLHPARRRKQQPRQGVSIPRATSRGSPLVLYRRSALQTRLPIRPPTLLTSGRGELRLARLPLKALPVEADSTEGDFSQQPDSVFSRHSCSAPGFLDSGLTVFASTLPRPARRGHVAPERDFDSGISPASTARCTFA